MAMGSKNLRRSRLLDHGSGLDDDPMSSMGNLMDVMLVFACGLMIALIAHYNVEFSPSDPDVGDVEKLEAELTEAQQGIANSDSSYAEVGAVYRDVETGELYMVSPTDEGGASEGSGGGAAE